MLTFRIGLLFLIVFYSKSTNVSCHPANESLRKIEKGLVQILSSKPGSTTGVFVSFKTGIQSVLEELKQTSYLTRNEKLTKLHLQLILHTEKVQKNLIDFLKYNHIEYQSFWISNQIYLPNADLTVLETLISLFDEILEIREEETLHILESWTPSEITTLAEWGIDKIQAPEAWGLDGGNNGFNSVVSSIATGVRVSHEALQGNYLDNGYSWFDPTGFTEAPNDENGVGTHTMGIMVGADGIGVAPGARWMACAGCSASGVCTQSSIFSCGQFILCPHDFTGSNPNCSKAPHIVNNIWGGGQGSTTFHPMIEAWIAGGIIPVFASGGSGPGCGSVGSPGDHPEVISVGSSTSNDSLSARSSQGPAYDGVTIKPDLIAPGESIRSAHHTSDNAYATLSGSSLSSSHVSGTIALLVGRKPSLTLEEAKAHLAEGAVQEGLKLPGVNCGDVNESTFPNNACGHGRVSALGSLFSLIISG